MSGAVIDALNDGPCHFFAKGVAGRAICTKAPARTYTFARPAAYKTDGTARCARRDLAGAAGCIATGRSEEHTSELQSLMRISYAVFCLKQKKKKKRIQYS